MSMFTDDEAPMREMIKIHLCRIYPCNSHKLQKLRVVLHAAVAFCYSCHVLFRLTLPGAEGEKTALRYKVWACPIPAVENGGAFGIRERKKYSIVNYEFIIDAAVNSPCVRRI